MKAREKNSLFKEELKLIPVTMIKQLYFCPNIVYFQGVLGYEERQTESMLTGKEEQEKEIKKEKRRMNLLARKNFKVLEKWFDLNLYSKKLGLIGRIDFVAKTNKGFILIEFKNAYLLNKPPAGHIYQSAAYAMLFEECFGFLIRSIILHYLKNDKSFEFKLTDDIRNHVLWAIKKINQILDREKFYPYKLMKKCKSCGYRLICRGY